MQELNYPRLRTLIAKGEARLVVEQLAEPDVAPERYRDAIQALSARYRALRRELIAGTQAPETTTRTRNQLTEATLALLTAMERGEDWPAESGESDPPRITIQGKNIVSGNVSNVGGDFRVGDNHGE